MAYKEGNWILSISKKDLHEHEGWNKTTIIACIIGTIDFVVLTIGILVNEATLSIAGVGLVTFFGMLIISSHHVIHHPDSKGTMRKAIAGSLVAVYVVILALLLSGKIDNNENELVITLVEHFSFVIITIIGFYFGSKGVTEFLEFWKNSKKISNS